VLQKLAFSPFTPHHERAMPVRRVGKQPQF
jgi:hypothetical protein